MSLQTSVSRHPCPAGHTYTITAGGGTPPYSFQVVPPSPSGTTVDANGEVSVPQGAASKSRIQVDVTDSGQPQETGVSRNSVT